MAEKQPFERLGRDLYFHVECNCPDPEWADSTVAHLFKREIILTGYADANFFDNANAEPREAECKCGRRLRYQWFRDGVVAEWIPN